MPKRFLNVEYNGVKAEIDVTDAERLGQVQDAIKEKYGPVMDTIGAAQIQLFDNKEMHINKWKLFNTLPQDYFEEEGLHLIIRITPPSIQHGVQSVVNWQESYSIGEPEENYIYKEYLEIANKLKDNVEVAALKETIQKQGTVKNFIVIPASSGIGKTQMAFNLQQAGVNVAYIPCFSGMELERQQPIYECFKWRTLAFHHCILRDVQSNSEESFLYSLIVAVLRGDKRWVPRALSSSEALKELEKENKLNVVFEDEFPKLEYNNDYTIKHLRHMRSSLLQIGITVILASTNSSSVNYLIPSAESRGPAIWCTVFPLYSPFLMPTNLDTLPPWLVVLLQYSRPLFAQSALTCYRENINSHLNEVEFLELVVSHVAMEMRVWKKERKKGFLHGQVCILLSAHRIEEVKEDKLYEGEKRSVIIEEHYANLDEETNKSFNLLKKSNEDSKDTRESSVAEQQRSGIEKSKKQKGTDKGKESKKQKVGDSVKEASGKKGSNEGEGPMMYLVKSSTRKRWNPTMKYLGPNQDLLLHFASHGFHGDNFLNDFESIYRTLNDKQTYTLPTYNDAQFSNNGKELEAKVTAVLILASRSNKFQTLDLKTFLSRFVQSLQRGQTTVDAMASQSDSINVPSFLENTRIPFLGFPSVEWPEEVLQKLPVFLGTIRRVPDSTKFDILGEIVVNGKKVTAFSVEVKDYQQSFGDTLLKETFQKRPADSPIHLIVVKSIVSKYKTSVNQPTAKRRKLNSKSKNLDYDSYVQQHLNILGNTFICRYENGGYHPINGIENYCRSHSPCSNGCAFTSAIIVVPLDQ
ncbi:hypothetical protein HDV04_001016 [Boothiomyces sp. JEL0838]|nr:hypothetical protein HDV04_001016 [Boothiomyces sp. JEL0838]